MLANNKPDQILPPGVHLTKSSHFATLLHYILYRVSNHEDHWQYREPTSKQRAKAAITTTLIGYIHLSTLHSSRGTVRKTSMPPAPKSIMPDIQSLYHQI